MAALLEGKKSQFKDLFGLRREKQLRSGKEKLYRLKVMDALFK